MKSNNLISITFILSVCLLSSSIQAAGKISQWTGRYRDAKRRDYDIVIDEWEPGQLQVDIVKVGKTSDNEKDVQAGFLAEVKGNIATWSSISECPISIKRTHEGIVVTDSCKGARDNTGLYKPVQP